MADITWGQRVAALIVTKKDGEEFDEKDFKNWCSEKMPSHMSPSILKLIEEIPRNAMGKINKKQLNIEFFPENV